jgi:hypothetical protein
MGCDGQSVKHLPFLVEVGTGINNVKVRVYPIPLNSLYMKVFNLMA